MTVSPPCLAIRDVDHSFGGVHAVSDVNLELRAGEICALLGENGAGKSTLISIMAGMQRPDSGQIEVAGRPVQIASPLAALRLGIGTVYQHVLLVPSLTVLENLMLGAPWWRSCDRKATLKRFTELSELLSTNVTPDSLVGRHTGAPVPAMLAAPRGRRDASTTFSEVSCMRGGLGRIPAVGFLASLLDGMGASPNYRPGADAPFVGP